MLIANTENVDKDLSNMEKKLKKTASSGQERIDKSQIVGRKKLCADLKKEKKLFMSLEKKNKELEYRIFNLEKSLDIALKKLNRIEEALPFYYDESQENRNLNSENLLSFLSLISDLPFYKAIFFTLTFTFTVTPIMLFLGLLIALGVNAINSKLKGLIIFFSLLPMIVTPLIGSIILFWMIDSRGIVGNFLQIMFEDPNLSLKASTLLTPEAIDD